MKKDKKNKRTTTMGSRSNAKPVHMSDSANELQECATTLVPSDQSSIGICEMGRIPCKTEPQPWLDAMLPSFPNEQLEWLAAPHHLDSNMERQHQYLSQAGQVLFDRNEEPWFEAATVSIPRRYPVAKVTKRSRQDMMLEEPTVKRTVRRVKSGTKALSRSVPSSLSPSEARMGRTNGPQEGVSNGVLMRTEQVHNEVLNEPRSVPSRPVTDSNTLGSKESADRLRNAAGFLEAGAAHPPDRCVRDRWMVLGQAERTSKGLQEAAGAFNKRTMTSYSSPPVILPEKVTRFITVFDDDELQPDQEPHSKFDSTGTVQREVDKDENPPRPNSNLVEEKQSMEPAEEIEEGEIISDDDSQCGGENAEDSSIRGLLMRCSECRAIGKKRHSGERLCRFSEGPITDYRSPNLLCSIVSNVVIMGHRKERSLSVVSIVKWASMRSLRDSTMRSQHTEWNDVIAEHAVATLAREGWMCIYANHIARSCVAVAVSRLIRVGGLQNIRKTITELL